VNWNARVRQAHRWVSIFFTLTVIANIAAMSLGGAKAPLWLSYVPLFPLAQLLWGGVYRYGLAVAARRRRGE
jgi:hypothetical protein